MEINKIYCENNLATMARMPDGFVDLTVTSPPYDNLRDYKGYEFDFEATAQELYRVTKPGGVVVWVVGDATINGSETGTSFRQALYFMECGFNLHDTMIYKTKGGKPQNPIVRYNQDWEYMFVFSKGAPKTTNIRTHPKTGRILTKKKRKRHAENEFSIGRYSEGGGPLSSVREYATGNGHSTKDKVAFRHPAIFPEKLAGEHIHSWSNKGDLVYDPFGGSGTVAKMAHLYGRSWIISDISPLYCDISEERIEPYLRQVLAF